MEKLSMNDIHMHIIPDVDDGARDEEMAHDMLLLAHQQGIRGIVATPHSSAFTWKGKEAVWERFRTLQEYMAQTFPDMGLYFGSEIFCTKHMMPSVLEALKSGKLPVMNGTRYVLTEFPVDMSGEEAIACIEQLCAQNWIPIIAHIERYPGLFKKPELIPKMMKYGCLIQINVYSVFSETNKNIRENTRMLVERKWVHFLGSDAHRTEHRPPDVKVGLQYLYEHYDEEYIDRIVSGNAEALLNLGQHPDKNLL